MQILISPRPLVSAIIPAFNAEGYISEAIESVLSQTYPSLECIVVDDGSTDNTAREIGRFEQDVVLIQQANSGVSAARNAGARSAGGEFLAFLDADDRWLAGKIERQMACFERDPGLAFSYGGYEVVDDDLQALEVVPALPAAEALRNAIALEPPGINLSQTGLIRRRAFESIGGFDEDLSTSADLDLVCRVCLRFSSCPVPEPVAQYRRRAEQMSTNVDLMKRDMLRVLAKLYADPSLPKQLLALKRRSYANLFLIVAATCLKEGRWYLGSRSVIIAVCYEPRVSLASILRRMGAMRAKS